MNFPQMPPERPPSGRWVEIAGERIWIPFMAMMGTEFIDPEERNRKWKPKP